MFWRKPRATIDAETIDWVLECWEWLDEVLGPVDAEPQRQLLMPSRTEFPDTRLVGHARADHYFKLVREKCGMQDWPVDLKAQARGTDLGASIVFGGHIKAQPPLGSFQLRRNAAVITYDPGILDQPIQLIATFAHELAHYLLKSWHCEPPGGAELEELATDLATVHMGFGLFGANTAFEFKQTANYDNQGWQTGGAGYLGENGWCFALALFCEVLDIEASTYQDYAKSTVAAQIKKNRAYIAAKPEMVRNIRSSTVASDEMMK
jgi:hypothetical protein